MRIKRFFKILSLFIFCIFCIYNGKEIKLDKAITFKELWIYCTKWEKGQL